MLWGWDGWETLFSLPDLFGPTEVSLQELEMYAEHWLPRQTLHTGRQRAAQHAWQPSGGWPSPLCLHTPSPVLARALMSPSWKSWSNPAVMEVFGGKGKCNQDTRGNFPPSASEINTHGPLWELMPGRESWWLQLPETLPAACMHLYAPKSGHVDLGRGEKQFPCSSWVQTLPCICAWRGKPLLVSAEWKASLHYLIFAHQHGKQQQHVR